MSPWTVVASLWLLLVSAQAPAVPPDLEPPAAAAKQEPGHALPVPLPEAPNGEILAPPATTEKPAEEKLPGPPPDAADFLNPLGKLADPEAPPDGDYLQGEVCFTQGELVGAVRAYNAYLAARPDPARVPEILYKLGVSHVIMNEPAEAKKFFFQLAEKHPTSIWALVVVHTHMGQEELDALATKNYVQARDKGDGSAAAQAIYQYRLLGNRFPNAAGAEKRTYRTAVCCRVVGQEKDYQKYLGLLAEKDKDNDWGKLARIRLGGCDAFRRGMDELAGMNAAERDSAALFCELADAYLADLEGEDRVKCRFYQARCLPEKDGDARRAVWHEIMEQHPTSPWAAESAFALAEQAHERGDYAAARQGYLDLARTYPDSPRAAKSAEWAQWLDRRGESSREIAGLYTRLLQRLAGSEGGLALRLEAVTDGNPRKLHARVALDRDRGLVDVDFAGRRFFLAATEEGTCYLSPNGNTLVRTPEKTPIPRPYFVCDYNPATDTWSAYWNLGPQADRKPMLNIPPAAGEKFVKGFLKGSHIRVDRGPAPDGRERTVVALESARWDPAASPDVLRIVVDGDTVREATFSWAGRGNVMTHCRLTDIALHEPLPPGTFAVPDFPGVAVQDAGKLNTAQVWGDIMQLGGQLVGEVMQDRQAK